jgi:hypothetical protein
MASNVPSLQTLALRAMRKEPRGIVGHSQRLRREREWLVSSGNLFNMPGNWTDRNVYAFLGPGYLFGYLVKKMLTMRDYVREMLRVLAEQTPPQLSLTQGANGWTRSVEIGVIIWAPMVALDFVAQNVFTSRLGVMILRHSGKRIFRSAQHDAVTAICCKMPYCSVKRPQNSRPRPDRGASVRNGEVELMSRGRGSSI